MSGKSNNNFRKTDKNCDFIVEIIEIWKHFKVDLIYNLVNALIRPDTVAEGVLQKSCLKNFVKFTKR